MSLFDFGQGITLKELLENPDLKCPPKDNNVGKKDKSGGYKIDPSSAFLGPNLWNNPDDDYNLEFMDLDEFLSENGISVGENDNSNTSDSNKGTGIKENKSEDTDFVDALLPLVNPAVLTEKINSPKEDILPESETEEEALDSPPLSPQVTYDVDPSDLALASIPGQDFDPKKRKFSVDELKPQPIIKKSRKVFVPEECKDQKYWSRRKKNNVAAKRSREARRIKENQIALRAAYLEKENNALKEEIKKMKLDNMNLTTRLEKYECRSLLRFNKSDIN